jgi:hypothetical protein
VAHPNPGWAAKGEGRALKKKIKQLKCVACIAEKSIIAGAIVATALGLLVSGEPVSVVIGILMAKFGIPRAVAAAAAAREPAGVIAVMLCADCG